MCFSIKADTLNIEAFGASSGDDLDDFNAIESAISAASPGDTIFFPEGTWNTSASITPPNGVSISGAGKDLTSIIFSGTEEEQSLISLEDLEDSQITIRDLTLDGNSSVYCSQGIEAYNLSNLRITDVLIKNLVNTPNEFGPHGIYFAGSVTDSNITNCEFINIGVDSEWGAGIRVSHQSARIEISNNIITETGRGGILLNDGVTGSTISNNQISQIGLHSVGISIEVFEECHQTIVEDNVVDHWISLDTSNFVAVRRNTIGGPTTTDIKFASLEAAGVCENCIFSDNIAGQGNHIGISVSNQGLKKHILFLRNTITNAATWGAQIQGDQEGAFRMYFRENRFENTINSTTSLYNAGGPGFRINENVRQFVFDQNTFSSNQLVGMQILDNNDPTQTTVGIDELTFINNTFTNNLGSSILVNPEATIENIQWENNVVANNTPDVSLSSIGFTSNIAPVATINSPDTIRVGHPVSLSYTIENGVPAQNALWDLDHHLPSNLTQPNIVYNTPGEYKISLVLWNTQGRASYIEKTIQVIDDLPKPIGNFIEIDGQTYFTITYPRVTQGTEIQSRYETTTGIYHIEVSSDSNQWEEISIPISPALNLALLPEGFEWGQARHTLPVTQAQKLFMRVRTQAR